MLWLRAAARAQAENDGKTAKSQKVEKCHEPRKVKKSKSRKCQDTKSQKVLRTQKFAKKHDKSKSTEKSKVNK